MDFNKRSRKANALFASSAGVIQQLVQIVGNFAYRTIFLYFLSEEYLGINGLFSNVLQLFSLAELGIGSAILYSMYQPFAQQDVKQISALIGFYKRVYNFLAILVVSLGLLFYPFLSTIGNVSEIPSDVNLTVVYFLFVAQSAMSYLFVYKQSLLTADQQSHKISLFTCLLQVVDYTVKILVLWISKDYVLVLAGSILSSLLLNWLFSFWITGKYNSVFKDKQKLDKLSRKKILTHTGGLLCHKIGYIVVTSTDNIILSKFIGLAAVGIYSNYAMIVMAITNIVNRIVSSLVPTIANYVLKKSKQDSYILLRRTLFINLWLASFTTVCLFLLLNPFIRLWLGPDFLLPVSAVAWICMQHYFQSARLTANTFINSCGLFHLDRFRPLVESAVNLTVSIYLANRIGITGVFIGTVVSGLVTYFWREPHLLHKHFFQKSTLRYWGIQLFWAGLTAAICFGGHFLFSLLGDGFVFFLVKMLLAATLPNLVILLLTFYTEDFRFAVNAFFRKIIQKFKRSKTGEA